MALGKALHGRLLGVLVIGLALPVALGGCAGPGSGATPTLTAGPPSPPSSASPTLATEGVPSATPTASPSSSPTGTIGSVSHATGPTDLLLRYGVSGGLMAPSQAALDQVPQFSLFGDGTAIYTAPATEFASAVPPLLQAHLTEPEIDALLDLALDAGGLRAARPTYDLAGVADAPTTRFTIHAGGVDKVVDVYALGIGGPTPTDDVARAGFTRLAAKLGDFEAVVADGQAADAGQFAPQAYRAYLLAGQATGPMRDWPWPELAPTDFSLVNESGLRSHVLTPAQALRLAATPGAGLTVLVLGPDRAPYQLVMIPLLPDQKS